MSFSSTQIRKLQRDVKACDIRTREVNGRDLHYIEGWHAIAEANRIFGFDAWSRETVESRCVTSRESRGTFHVLYIARVRITVRADAEIVVREGFGTGEAHAPTPGEAHDKAIKTAETDATKRALATFGKPFGLSLYAGARQPGRPKKTDIQRRRTLQKLGANGRFHIAAQPKPPTILQALAAPVSRDDLTEDKPTQGEPAPSDIAEPRLLIERTTRRRDPHHLRFVAAQPCLICGRTPSDAHHLKFAQPQALGRKVSDEYTVPLCRTHHRQLHHAGSEVAWWMDLDVDPLPIAQGLWEESKGKQGSSSNG